MLKLNRKWKQEFEFKFLLRKARTCFPCILCYCQLSQQNVSSLACHKVQHKRKWVSKNLNESLTHYYLTWSPSWWGLEYADCILCRKVRFPSPLKKSSGYDTKLHLMVTLQFWRSVECGVLLHCHYFQVHPDQNGKTG